MQQTQTPHTPLSNSRQLRKGILAGLPLSIAVIPWGILAGSYAVDAGLNTLEAQAMSAILFAGSVQLVIAGMFKAGIGLGTMLLTTFFIASRHLLYSVSMRSKISALPLRWRLTLGFWLTDELFAICSGQKDSEFNRWYAAGVGGSFYVIWNLASLVGIVAGSQFPQLNGLGLEFAVAATFIALVVPQVNNIPVVCSVLVSAVSAVYFTLLGFTSALIFASVLGMICGYGSERLQHRVITRRTAAGETMESSE